MYLHGLTNKYFMKFTWFGILIIIVFCFTANINSQTDAIIEAKAKEELAKRNIPEELMRSKLIERGYDPDNISPEQLPEYHMVIEEILAEIEAEKKDTESELIQNIEIKVENSNPKDSMVLAEKEVDTSNKIEKVVTEISPEKPIANIYGHHLFDGEKLRVVKSDNNLLVPDTYVLSTGDKIQVSIFGASQGEFIFTIGENGYVDATNVGKIFLKGLTVAEAKKLLKNRFSRRYRFLPEQFTMVVLGVRPVTINIFGEVQSPGSYRISAANNGLNALMAAGGINPSGSVRNIKLVKSTGETQIIDVYKFLNDPKSQFEYALDDQDMIFVPLAENIVSVSGGVKRPMRYELKSGEDVSKLIDFSGGLTLNANRDYIEVSRVVNGRREVTDIQSKSSYTLLDGDRVNVKESEEYIASLVKITGEVKYTGEYEYTAGMSLHSLLSKAQLTEYSREDIAYIFRHQPDGTRKLERVDVKNSRNIKLMDKDEVLILSIVAYSEGNREVAINGAVKNPRTLVFNPDENIRISDLILLSGGLKKNASAEAILTRRDLTNRARKSYEKVNIFEIITNPTSEDNLVLVGGDVLQIYENERYNQLGDVSIVGAVLNPDTVVYDETLTLNKLLLLAGGTLKNTNDIGIIKRKASDNDKEYSYLRFSLKDIEDGKIVDLQVNDEVRLFNKNTFLNNFDVKIYGEVNNPGVFDFDTSLQLADAIYMAGGLTFKAAKNRVEVYRLDIEDNSGTKILVKNLELTGSKNGEVTINEEFQLEPFDIVIVRPMPDFKLQEVVYLSGQVRYPGPYILTKENERLSDLVERAGGLKYDAFPAGATLIRKRGEKTGNIFIELDQALKWGDKYEDIVLRAGDIVSIPQKENVVSIKTKGTRSAFHYDDSVIHNGSIQLAYQGRRSAKWYVDNFAGGLDENVDKRTIRVIDPSGRIKATKRYLWCIYDYPTVIEGSTVAMDFKRPKKKKEKSTDWGKSLSDTMAVIATAVTAVVPLILLINNQSK